MDPGAIPRSDSTPKPPVINYILSFLLVGVAWGFTTPFIRRAAADFQARQEGKQRSSASGGGGQKGRTQTRARRETRGREDDDDGEGEGEGDETELLSRHEDEHSFSDDNHDGHTDNHDHEHDSDTENEDTPTPNRQNTQRTTPHPAWMTPSPSLTSYLITKTTHLMHTILNLLLTPAYSIPLVINLTGSIWFFLLVGQHGTLHFLTRGKTKRTKLMTWQNYHLQCHLPIAVRFSSPCSVSGMLSAG